MSEKYPGGFVTYNPPTPSQTSATGIWTLSQQEQYQQAGLWPNSPSQVSRSLRFNSADSAFLRRTPTYASNRQTWTWSGWVKRSTINGTYQNIFQTIGAAGGDNDYFSFRIMNGEQIGVVLYSYFPLISTQVLRDVSAWYHFVCVLDTTQATASNRLKIYINGVEVTAWSTDNRSSISQNSNLGINSAAQHNIGAYNGSSEFFSGYMANVQFVDGQALDPTSFGEYNANTGVWQPLQKNLTYGTNGFQLTFNDNTNTTATTLGADSSGNGNNFTPSNFSVTAGAGNDSLVDSPTSYGTDTGVGGTVRGNYCTWNPLKNPQVAVLTNGNLDLSTAGSTARYGTYTTLGVTTGQWYWEITAGSLSTDGYNIGIVNASKPDTTALNADTNSYIYLDTGLKGYNGTGTAYGATYTAGDVIGVALDLDAGTLVFYKNGTSQGTAFTSIASNTWFPTVADNATGSTTGSSFIANFGQRPFAYTAPSGYKALCTQNLPTPTIGATTATLANQFFTPVLYTGDGTNNRTISAGMTPDWTWIKERGRAGSHFEFDTLRGTGVYLSTNGTGGDNYAGSLGWTNSGPTTGGFKVDVGTNDGINYNTGTYVAWNWKANGSGSTNTAGSITSTVSANTTSGFSVVTYTGNSTNGATIGHGLGVAPVFVIVKSRNDTFDWIVWSKSFATNSTTAFLNTTNAAGAYSVWSSTLPSSTVITLPSSSYVNGTSKTYVAYCFAPIAGYSAFGSYTGNGSADGPFVFTGFRPAFVMVKASAGTSAALANWLILDNTRNTYNVANNKLAANLSEAENGTSIGTSADNNYDFLSNGFKARTTNGSSNESGTTYIYMAFAQNPFKYSLAR